MASTIEITAPGGTAQAYLARPDGQPHPGVLLLMDGIGLRPQIAQMVDRIASWGYVVLAPNGFYRDGTIAQTGPPPGVDLRAPGAREEFFGTVMPRLSGLTADKSNPDAEVWIDTLQQHAPGPIGLTGYCMGVRMAIRAAGLAPDIVAAVGGFHGGGVVVDGSDSPHLQIPDSTAEYVFGHADNDPSMPPEAVATLGETLEAAGRTHLNQVYAGAAHGYAMADTSMYDKGAAERHFTELRALLDRTL